MADPFSQGMGANFGPLGYGGGPASGAGNLAKTGYQWSGPINLGSTQYQQGAGATQANPWGGDAGIRPYNPAISESIPAAWSPPSFGNTMGGGAFYGKTASSAGPGAFGNTIAPESWNRIAASTRANQNPSMFAGGTPSMWGGAGSSGGSAWDPQGTAQAASSRIASGGTVSAWDPQGTGRAASDRLWSTPGYLNNTGANAVAGGPGRSPSGPSFAGGGGNSGGGGSVSDTLAGLSGNVWAAPGWDTPSTATDANQSLSSILAHQPRTLAWNGQPNWGLVNNNPGNIVRSPWTASQPGYVSGSGRFGEFSDMNRGVNALESNLQAYGGRGINTPASVANVWAPPSENNTARYAAGLTAATGASSPNSYLNMSDPMTQYRLASGIASNETGTPLSTIQNAGINASRNQGLSKDFYNRLYGG